MAEVDFSNARITPAGDACCAAYPYLNLTTSASIFNANKTSIGTCTGTRLSNEQKNFVIMYRGTLNASGTEFYIWQYSSSSGTPMYAALKVSNISFQSGDTYTLKIRADLICQ